MTSSPEETLLLDQAGAWRRRHAPVSAYRRLRAAAPERGYDAALFRQMADMGWAGVTVPEPFGGAGLGHHTLGLLHEELGRSLTASPLLMSGVGGAGALMLAGDPAQQQAWLPKLAAGKLVATVALDEGPRHTPEQVAACAAPAAGGRVLNGCKAPVLDGMAADLLVVSARAGIAAGGAEDRVLLLVAADAPGVVREPLDLAGGGGAAQIRFSDVRLPAEAVLAEGAAAVAAVDDLLDRLRAVVAAEMIGAAQAAFELTLEHLKIREQFGQPIGGFQALQHRAVRMYGELELARSCVLAALSAIDAAAAERAELCSLAKAQAGEALFLVTNEAIQMHGGIGMTEEHDVGLYLKRARLQEAAFGNRAFHRDRYARLRGF